MAASPPSLPTDASQPARTSGLAIASVVLGVLSCPFSVLASIPGLICGIVGLNQIRRSEAGGSGPRLTGRGMALTGIILSALMTLAFPVMVGLLLPAVQAARDAARSVEVSNNLKQISLAMMNVEQAAGCLPMAIIDPDAKPLLSWRVAILPFLGDEEAALYKEFHLDEPWDSDHNKPLIARMPAVYASPGMSAEQGLTDVVVPVGEGHAFGEADTASSITPNDTAGLAGVKPGSISDGLSKTICIMSLPGFQVPWTQPADFKGDAADLFTNLRGEGIRSVVLGTGDAAARRVSTDLDPRVVRAVFSKAGGEVVPIDAF